MLQDALKYLRMGFSVIPLRPCGKEPLIKWEEYQKRRPTEAEVTQWFRSHPKANCGIVTGELSGLAIVDLDGSEGIKSGHSLGLVSPATAITGDGRQLYYKWTGHVSNSVKKIAPGVDTRGDGGYVVAPPSTHPNGRRYRWLGIPNFSALSALPTNILSTTVSATTPVVSRKEEGWISKALEEMKDGNIDDTLTSVCGRLRRDGYSEDDARTLLQPFADRVGASPGHLDEKIENIWTRYPPNREVRGQHLGMDRSDALLGTLVIHSPTNPDSIQQFEQLHSDASSAAVGGLYTGYAKLDAMLHGGLKSARLFTLAARTGTGKTNWLIGVARSFCASGKRVLLFSTETPFNEIWDRYKATLPRPEEFRSHPLFVCDSFAPNLEKVEEAIAKVKPDLFIFDHINHVSEEQRELGAFMQGLNFLRRKYECCGIVSAQLNRSADWVDLKTGEKVTPRMSMIKGSGTIEQASSRVLLLSETRVTPEYTEIIGNLDKNDKGPKGLVHFGLFNSPYRMVEL